MSDVFATPRTGAVEERLAVSKRALGSVVAAAAGDALGAPYEFMEPIADSDDVDMIGGGILGWDAGEWTDDTAMAIVVLEAAAAQPGHDLRSSAALDHIARDWYSWSLGTRDVGGLTSTVIGEAITQAAAHHRSVPRGEDFFAAAARAHDTIPMTAGNGALMRAHASVLPHLHCSDQVALEAIDRICRLTHVHPDARDASCLWGMAVRHAILTGQIDIRHGISALSPESATIWNRRIDEAEAAVPGAFRRNGWVVGAFQCAWSAIHAQLPLPEGKFAQREAMTKALEAAVRSGYDTDTVACITGALLGAALGPKAVRTEWRRALFGWPGYELADLEALVSRVLNPTEIEGAAS